MGVEQDGGGLRLIDVDPHAHAIRCLEPVLDVERPAAHARKAAFGPITRTGPAPARFRISWPLTPRFEVALVLDGDPGRPALILARLNAFRRTSSGRRAARPKRHKCSTRGPPWFRAWLSSIDDRRRVEQRIANAAPPHGAEILPRLAARVKYRAI